MVQIFSVLNLKCTLNGANVILILNKVHSKLKPINSVQGKIAPYRSRRHHRRRRMFVS